MSLIEIGLKARDQIHLAQDRDKQRALAKTVMNFRVL